MKRYHLKLDGVGCLSLLVLTGAIQWFLSSRFPDHGWAFGALLWLVSIALGTFIVARAVGRDERAQVDKLASAKCPWCGEAPAAAALREGWQSEAERLISDGMKQGFRADSQHAWRGKCGACGQPIALDPEQGNVKRDER